MDEKQGNTINRLTEFLSDHYDPELIILYGSTARGDTDEFSDVDIMVIMDVEDSEKVTAEMLAGTNHIVNDKHIMLKSSEDYYNQRDIPGTMVYSAVSEGLILFRREGFDIEALPLKDYEERKRDIIEKEYIGPAHEFWEDGRLAIDNKQLFRCRDYMRFAVVRMLKAVIVFGDVHPPRGTALEELFKSARNFIPQLGKLKTLIDELNDYYPAGTAPEEYIKCNDIMNKTRFIIDFIAFRVRPGKIA